MRPSSRRSSTVSTVQAQPIGLSSSSAIHRIPNSRCSSQALLDHRAVAVLEDVQRHVLGGQRHDAEREQREVAVQALRHMQSLRG